MSSCYTLPWWHTYATPNRQVVNTVYMVYTLLYRHVQYCHNLITQLKKLLLLQLYCIAGYIQASDRNIFSNAATAAKPLSALCERPTNHIFITIEQKHGAKCMLKEH